MRYRDKTLDGTLVTLGEAFGIEGGGQGAQRKIKEALLHLRNIRIATFIAQQEATGIKIEAAIQNARSACALREAEGSLAGYFWRFEPSAGERPRRITPSALRALTESNASRALARDLKQRGWRFVGPTTVYAFMQAMGLVNDHLEGCEFRESVEGKRRKLKRPR